MAITSTGYTGTVNEAQWANLMSFAAGNKYGVAGTIDWRVTAAPAVDRGVIVAIGSGWGHGVLDTSDTQVTLVGAPITSGTRWDMVVAHRNWAGIASGTTFALISGTSSKTLPARQVTPGITDDQPLALVQFTAGQAGATAIVDLRVQPGSGGMVGNDLLARDYMTHAGARLVIKGEDWVCTTGTAGDTLTWSRQSSLNATQLFAAGWALFGVAPPVTTNNFLIQAGSTGQITDGGSYAKIIWPVPFPNGLLSVTAMNGDDWGSGGTCHFVSSGNVGAHGTAAYGDKIQWVYAMLSQDPASKNMGRYTPNKAHKINWIAIGW